MRTDPLEALRKHDPASALAPSTTEDRESVRRAIVAGPYDHSASARRRRRRLVVIAVAVGLLILLGATAVYAGSYLLDPITKGPNPPMSGREWRAEYEAWTQKIPLPQGARWRGFFNPEIDIDHISTSRGAGALDATFEAMGHWTKVWVAAAAAGDTTRANEARTWVTRLLDTIPAITDEDTEAAFDSKYGTESMAGMDEAGHRYLEKAIAAASQGHFSELIRQTVGYTYWPAPGANATPKPTHYHGMDAQSDGGTPMISGDEAWAQYQDVLRTVGTPPGLDVAGARRQVLADSTVFGGGFERGFEDAWAAWWEEWARAAKAGDEAGMTAASAATRELQDLLPHTVTAHGRQETYFYTGDAKRDLAELSVRARRGDMSGIEEWLAFQKWYRGLMRSAAGYDELKQVYDGPAHPVVWETTPDAQSLDAAAAAAGYAAAQQAFDLPAGVSWPEWPAGDGPEARRLTAGDGWQRAAGFAWLTWWRAWLAAARADDQAGAKQAEDASARLHDLLAEGTRLDGGVNVQASAATLRDFEELDARARKGDLDGLQDWSTYQAVSKRGIGSAGD